MVGTPRHSKVAVGSRKQNTLLVGFSLWPNSSNEAPPSKVSPPPNDKLCCEHHLITPWIRSEFSWSSHFHGVLVHLDEDFNKWTFREQIRNKLKQKQWGSHKTELKSHKGVTFKFSLKEEQKSPKMAEKKRHRPSKDPGATEQTTFYYVQMKKLRLYAERNYPFWIRKDGDIKRPD